MAVTGRSPYLPPSPAAEDDEADEATFGLRVNLPDSPGGGGLCGIFATGSLDASAVGAFERTVRRALQAGPAEVDVDLGQVRFIDSSGLRALVAGRRACRAAGAAFRLLNPTPRTVRILEVTGLDSLFA
ncbi:MAG: STAS domain-containing protein [Acidimicrobiia bacterium]